MNVKIGKWTAELETYRPKEGEQEIKAKDFEVTKVELGTIDRADKNNLLKEMAQQMLYSSWEDGKEKKELKHTISSLLQFINTFYSFDATPLVQSPQIFDPDSSKSKNFLSQVQ